MNNEKRQFNRIFYQADATLCDQTSIQPCKIEDLSLNGCLLSFDTQWNNDIDSIYTLKLKLSDDVAIEMQLTAAHIIGNHVGFKCIHIDIDSITQLKRLVELNLGSSELLERDMIALTEKT